MVFAESHLSVAEALITCLHAACQAHLPGCTALFFDAQIGKARP